MSVPIEDYGLIGDCHTAALVSRQGSIDWLCLPRFDSPAVFASLLGTEENGRWQICPVAEPTAVARFYRDSTLVLETRFQTPEGEVALLDCMPPRTHEPDVVRIVRGISGRVRMRMELILRCDYGSIVPWVTRMERGIRAVAGPDTVLVYSDVELHGEDLHTVAEFTVEAGQDVCFTLVWHPSHLLPPQPPDAEGILEHTEEWWRKWIAQCAYRGPWETAVKRSLVTLKALTYAPSGGIVAAVTTSLPEQIGGVRNWDYRYCWVRDASFTLDVLMGCGFTREALAWREWLLRAVAGSPSQLNIMYGIRGERRLPELTLDWLAGYENSRPVRIGNAAYQQYQLDVYGELINSLYLAQLYGVPMDDAAWRVESALITYLETGWREPDEGIWEVRGPRRHFTHSKVMAWVAFDRMIKLAEDSKLAAPVDRWRKIRSEIHDEVCTRGIDPERGCFKQHYDANELDASLLMIPLVGFLPAHDSRMRATIEHIDRDLTVDGFVHRYATASGVDGLPAGEGAFLACSFWMVECLALLGRRDEARQRLERLIALANDLGLLAEEYDPRLARQVGNFPQALSHVALVAAALQFQRLDGDNDA